MEQIDENAIKETRLLVLSNIFIKIYGNFALDNSKIKQDTGVKLTSTSESMILLPL